MASHQSDFISVATCAYANTHLHKQTMFLWSHQGSRILGGQREDSTGPVQQLTVGIMTTETLKPSNRRINTRRVPKVRLNLFHHTQCVYLLLSWYLCLTLASKLCELMK